MLATNDNITGVLKITGTLDMESAAGLRDTLLDCLSQQPEVAIDLGEVEACDTASLQLLLAAWKEAGSLQKPFRFVAASNPVVATAAALGFSRIIPSTPAANPV